MTELRDHSNARVQRLPVEPRYSKPLGAETFLFHDGNRDAWHGKRTYGGVLKPCILVTSYEGSQGMSMEEFRASTFPNDDIWGKAFEALQTKVPRYPRANSHDVFLSRSGECDVYERPDPHADRPRLVVVNSAELSTSLRLEYLEARPSIHPSWRAGMLCLRERGWSLKIPGVDTPDETNPHADPDENPFEIAPHHVEVGPRYIHLTPGDRFLCRSEDVDLYERIESDGVRRLVGRWEDAKTHRPDYGMDRTIPIPDLENIEESHLKICWRDGLKALEEKGATNMGENDPNYNPMMDDPDFRRKQRRTTRKTTTEEVVEEEYEDDDYEYEEEEEGEEMPEENGIGQAIGQAVVAGAKQAGAAQLNDMMTGQIKKALVHAGVLSKEAEHNMLVDAAIKALAPMAIMFLAEKFPNQVPQAALVKEGAKLALTSATTEVVQPIMMLATPMFKQIAAAASEQRALDGDSENTENKNERGEIEIDVADAG